MKTARVRCALVEGCPFQGDCRRDPTATLGNCPLRGTDYFEAPPKTAIRKAQQLQGL